MSCCPVALTAQLCYWLSWYWHLLPCTDRFVTPKKVQCTHFQLEKHKNILKRWSHPELPISRVFPGVFQLYRNPTVLGTPSWTEQGTGQICTLKTWPKYEGNSGQQPISFQLHSCPSREEPWETNKVASENFMVTLCSKARHNSTHCKKWFLKKREKHTHTEAQWAKRTQEAASWQRTRDDEQWRPWQQRWTVYVGARASQQKDNKRGMWSKQVAEKTAILFGADDCSSSRHALPAAT